MFTPEVLEIPVRWENNELLQRSGYTLGEAPDNPVLRVYRGYRYRFLVDVPEGHSFTIKTAPGLLLSNLYSDGITNNGIFKGVIEWAVSDSSPVRLVYQSASDLRVRGLIEVADLASQPVDRPQRVNFAGEFADSLAEVARKVNHNARLLLSAGPALAGPGLKYKDRKLSLDQAAESHFYQTPEGQILRADEAFVLPDRPTYRPQQTEFGLAEALEQLAALLIQIKDPSSDWQDLPATNLRELEDLAQSLQSEVRTLTQKFRVLERRVNGQ